MFYLKKSRVSGFTLIELLVVIAIIGVLSSVVMVSINNSRAKARDVKRIADIRQLVNALELYYSANNSYPMGSGWCTQISHPSYTTSFYNSISQYLPSGLSKDPLYANTEKDYFYRRVGNTYYLYAEMETFDREDDGFSGCARINNINNEYDYRYPPF